MTKEEKYFKELSYKTLTGRIEYWDISKGFGKISTDVYENINFNKKEIINSYMNIEKDMFVDFILDESEDRKKAEKIIIKEMKLIYSEFCDESFKIDSQLIVIDKNKNKYIIEESNIRNFKYHHKSSRIKLEIFDNGFIYAKVLNKGYIENFDVNQNYGYIKPFDINDISTYKFRIVDLINSFEVICNRIVWFEIREKYANNVYISDQIVIVDKKILIPKEKQEKYWYLSDQSNKDIKIEKTKIKDLNFAHDKSLLSCDYINNEIISARIAFIGIIQKINEDKSGYVKNYFNHELLKFNNEDLKIICNLKVNDIVIFEKKNEKYARIVKFLTLEIGFNKQFFITLIDGQVFNLNPVNIGKINWLNSKTNDGGAILFNEREYRFRNIDIISSRQLRENDSVFFNEEERKGMFYARNIFKKDF